MPPDHIRDIKTEIGSIEGDDLTFLSVIEYNIETAGQGDEEFLKLTVGMAAAHFAARNVVDPIRSLNDKRHGTARFDEGEVAPVIGDLGEIYKAAVIH
jgi:hypothetical protein